MMYVGSEIIINAEHSSHCIALCIASCDQGFPLRHEYVEISVMRNLPVSSSWRRGWSLYMQRLELLPSAEN